MGPARAVDRVRVFNLRELDEDAAVFPAFGLKFMADGSEHDVRHRLEAAARTTTLARPEPLLKIAAFTVQNLEALKIAVTWRLVEASWRIFIRGAHTNFKILWPSLSGGRRSYLPVTDAYSSGQSIRSIGDSSYVILLQHSPRSGTIVLLDTECCK
ncbi:hypothetical protein BDY19DRAFT_906859 [Irpex rosettiformis]|uniref:Uncharacterized protein n=1 Tax=Irpex rosettiformis TaxID=378272 RepID=A0ACB8U269_9APHY|nr:hypothetical protein BDY19DRAFT_906859 [Irpex rosettiformis]